MLPQKVSEFELCTKDLFNVLHGLIDNNNTCKLSKQDLEDSEENEGMKKEQRRKVFSSGRRRDGLDLAWLGTQFIKARFLPNRACLP